jgi:hypothetical protein
VLKRVRARVDELTRVAAVLRGKSKYTEALSKVTQALIDCDTYGMLNGDPTDLGAGVRCSHVMDFDHFHEKAGREVLDLQDRTLAGKAYEAVTRLHEAREKLGKVKEHPNDRYSIHRRLRSLDDSIRYFKEGLFGHPNFTSLIVAAEECLRSWSGHGEMPEVLAHVIKLAQHWEGYFMTTKTSPKMDV